MRLRELHAFSSACEALYAPGLRLENFVTRGFAMLRAMIPCEFIACGVLEKSSRRLSIGFDTDHPDFATTMPAFGRLMDRYALYDFNPATNGGRPYCRRHFFTERQFRDIAMYAEVYRPLGISNHCAVHVPSVPGEVLYYGIERSGGPDFSEEELRVVALVQTQLTNAHAMARVQATALDEIVEPELLVCAGLTPREADTLFWMTHGKSNAEIATILGLTLATVKKYVATLFDKTGTDNRHAAIVWAQRTCLQLRHAGAAPRGFVEVPAPPHRPTPVN